MAEDRSKLGPAQLEILEYIQQHQPATVRQVADFLAEARGVTRTTALNMMERLRKRGYLTRDKLDGVYHYSPCIGRPQFLRGLVRDFVTQALGGSLEPFAAYLAEDAQLSDEDLARLQQRVKELREQVREEGS